jgi:catechol 2,3-dioxygenase-like lactoylglutathione lyase family enzyme
MISGTHILLYSKNPEADRTFFRDVLKFRAVDAGGGWLIFALPPAEMGVHPSDGVSGPRHADHEIAPTVLYLMCDDLRSTVASLTAKNVVCTEVETENWGVRTTFRLPSGAEIGLYQPTHPTAIGN